MRHVIILLLLYAGMPMLGAQTVLPDPAPERAWRPLHDGRTLNGWRQVCGDGGFRVENGAIVGRPGKGYPSSYLVTTEVFSDFLLEYEFRTEGALNGGVQLRSRTRPLQNGMDVVGYQVEIDPSPRSWSAGLYEQGLRGWLASLEDRKAARHAYRAGEWNRVRVLARGPRIRTWINGTPAVDVLDAAADRGFVGLQAHQMVESRGERIRWRHLRVKELPAIAATREWTAAQRSETTWRVHGEGLALRRRSDALHLDLNDVTRGPGFLSVRDPMGDGALVLRFRYRRAGLHLVVGARTADWQGGTGGVEVALEPPAGGGLWRPDGKRTPWRRMLVKEEADEVHELAVIRCGDRLVVRLDGERLHETPEIRLGADEGRGAIWGLAFPASRRPALDLLSARFFALAKP